MLLAALAGAGASGGTSPAPRDPAAGYNDAYTTRGSSGAAAIDGQPLSLSRNRTFVHVRPPFVVRKTPRSGPAVRSPIARDEHVVRIARADDNRTDVMRFAGARRSSTSHRHHSIGRLRRRASPRLCRHRSPGCSSGRPPARRPTRHQPNRKSASRSVPRSCSSRRRRQACRSNRCSDRRGRWLPPTHGQRETVRSDAISARPVTPGLTESAPSGVSAHAARTNISK